MNNTYDDMTLEQLDEANQLLMAQKEAIRAEQRELAAAVERRLAHDEAALMSPERRAALVQAIQTIEADGTASEEKFGQVGATVAESEAPA